MLHTDRLLTEMSQAHTSTDEITTIVTGSNDEYGDHSLALWVHQKDGAKGAWWFKLRDAVKKTAVVILKFLHRAILVVAIVLICEHVSHHLISCNQNANLTHHSSPKPQCGATKVPLTPSHKCLDYPLHSHTSAHAPRIQKTER